MNRGASAFILLLVLCSAFVLLAEVGTVYADGTIYIRADGNIEGTDTIQRDGNVYTFTGDISGSLVVERDNIMVDGAGHVLEGAGAGRGIFLDGRSNVTIKNITIREFDFGIDLSNSSGNTISANAIANTSTGIYLVSSSDSNSVSANTMANNQWGISLTGASNSSISANNISNNDVGISLTGASNNSISANNITNNNVYGISLSFISNNSISANNIANNSYGIYLYSPSGSNSISANNITNNNVGIYLYSISNNSISENTITNNVNGIFLESSSGNSISENTITNNNPDGLYLYSSSGNSISKNTITNNSNGTLLYSSSDNTLTANTVTNNIKGISLYYCSNNTICHNNFMDNTAQAIVDPLEYVNVWDTGYPPGGNYWSDYSGVDLNSGPYQNETGSDGIGDTNYTISTGNNDRYPLMGPISTFDCGTWDNKPYYADIVSNSTISAFNFNAAQKLISFNVNGSSETIGFCKITIDNTLLGGPYTVSVDETPVTPSVTSNGTHSFLYFTYAHSSHNVSIIGSTVIPESLLWIILPLLIMGTLFAVAARKKISRQPPQKG